jgi:aspartate carbamoyltransferase regulatory subunit
VLYAVWRNRYEPTIVPVPTVMAVAPTVSMSKSRKKQQLKLKAKKQGKPLFFTPIDFGTIIDHLPYVDALLINAWLLYIGAIRLSEPGIKAAIGPLATTRDGFGGAKGVEVIEGVILPQEVMAALQWVFATAVFNLVKPSVFEKYVFPLPAKGELRLIPDGVLPCPNPKCISNKCSQARTGFRILNSGQAICRRCERMFTPVEVKDKIKKTVGTVRMPGQGLV